MRDPARPHWEERHYEDLEADYQERRAAERAAICDLYRSGESLRSVCDAVGRSYGYVRDVLLEEQVPRRTTRAYRPMALTEIHIALQLYSGGCSLQEVADKVGWSRPKIAMEIRKAGVEIRPKGRSRKSDEGVHAR